MPATPSGYPYPDGSAKLGEMDLAIKALAEKIESNLKTVQSGSGVIPIVSKDVVRDLRVNFPVAFLTTPAVTATPRTSLTGRSLAIGGEDATGFTVYGVNSSSSSGFGFNWIAQG